MSDVFRAEMSVTGREAIFTSPQAHALSLAKIRGLTENEALHEFEKIRWAATDGAPVCHRCDGRAVYRYNNHRIFRCKSCKAQFSVTSGTVFSSRKLPFKALLKAVALFADKTRNPSGLQLARDMDVQYRTAFALCHKLYRGSGSPIRSLRDIPRVVMVYPFVQRMRSENADLLAVNRLVPRGLPEWVRADICQSIMLSVIEGAVTLGELERNPGLMKKFIRAFYKEQTPWNEITGFGRHDDDRSYEDIASSIHAENYHNEQSERRGTFNAIARRFYEPTQFDAVYLKQVAAARGEDFDEMAEISATISSGTP